jgi:hypothetical protein
MQVEPPEIYPQNLNCLKIYPANLIRLAYSSNKLWLRQYIGGVDRNILSPLTSASPFNLAVSRGNGNRFFAQKLHVEIANNPQSPHSQIESQ